MLHNNLSVNALGHLTLAGVDTVALAERYGTPLMLMDEERIRERMRIYRDGMRRHMGQSSFPCFASKAFCCKEIYRIAASEGIGIDVVSSGELLTAHAAGFPLSRAMFHGNNKTDEDIALGLKLGIGFFVADNTEELASISAMANEMGIEQSVLLRLTPGIDPHTHAKITTGQVDSKFGFAIETGQAEEAVRYALSLPAIHLRGFHCHVGSQCFDSTSFLDAAAIMLTFAARMRHRYSYTTEILNLGGGYGVRYVESDPEMDIEENLCQVGEQIDLLCNDLGIPHPTIVMEPGRSIVADAGVTLYQCGSVKSIPGYKTYVSVNGGMPDNPRFALYQSAYTILNASHADRESNLIATIAGRCCESGDILQENVSLFRPTRGDIISVLVTGAYNYAMASHYNRIPKPPVVMIKDGIDRLIIRRETAEDLMRLEV